MAEWKECGSDFHLFLVTYQFSVTRRGKRMCQEIRKACEENREKYGDAGSATAGMSVVCRALSDYMKSMRK